MGIVQLRLLQVLPGLVSVTATKGPLRSQEGWDPGLSGGDWFSDGAHGQFIHSACGRQNAPVAVEAD